MPRPSSSPRRGHRLAVVGLGTVTAWAFALVANRTLRRVEGASMLPSLWPDDLLLTVPATLLRPLPGDVVVADLAGRGVTKRLAGTPGQPVALRDGHLLVDGAWWALPHVVRVDEDAAFAPAADEVVLLGDHRARSTDARALGPLPAAAVRRVAVARLFPWRWLRGRAVPVEGARTRAGVRLVVLDPDDRVLLFRVTDADGGDATWWEAPGGGRHDAEPPEVAAARELLEEVGAHAVPLPLGEVHERVTLLGGGAVTKVEDVFAVRVPDGTVDASGWTTSEARDIAEHRWWTMDDLARLGDGEVVPADIVRLAHAATQRV